MRVKRPFRLAAIATAVSAATLGLLFVATVQYVRFSVFAERRAELESGLDALLLNPTGPFNPVGFREAHPELSVGVFEGGRGVTFGPLPVHRVVGFKSTGKEFLYGRRFRDQVIVAASDWNGSEHELRILALGLGVLWIPLSLVIGIATYLAARATFRPLERLTAQAASAAGASLGERLETDDPAEFGEFARALNGMLERIETEVRRGDRFAADAAHELRTPLAVLRTRIETALLHPRTPDEYVAILRRAQGEIVRLSEITQALLRTARGEGEAVPILEILPIVREGVDGWRERFEVKSVRLAEECAEARGAISAEEVRMVLDNLLDNALRFSPAGSTVMVRLDRISEGLELSVRDEGPGIPPELGDRAFDRLTRAGDDRNRATGGAGIGLSIVRRIGESRGGRAFQRVAEGGGAVVGIVLPHPES